jgi:hypothetical protein
MVMASLPMEMGRIVRMRCVALVALFLLATTGFSQSKPGSSRQRTRDLRELVANAYAQNEIDDQAMQGVLSQIVQLASGDNVGTRTRQQQLEPLADCVVAIHFLQRQPLKRGVGLDFSRWLWCDPDRSQLFLEYFDSEYDNLGEAMGILEELYAHDPANRNQLYPLMLALALVWDTPRPPLHGQCGPNVGPVPRDMKRRYDHFASMFLTKKPPVPFSRLSVSALGFVVDTPVPVSELSWAIENIRGTNFKRIFESVKYDDRRVEAGVFSWPHGRYSLDLIKRHGGICVDQAFFSLLAARARGIPAILFTGVGKRGGHAWLAVMKQNGDWDKDIGRYARDDYVTGHALNPLNGTMINDHLLPLVCERTMRNSNASQSDALARIAIVLAGLKLTRQANIYADKALEITRTHPQAWNVKMLTSNGDPKSLSKLFDEQADAYAKYPDHVVSIRQKQAEVLRQGGHDQLAERALAQTKAQTRNRDDLERATALARVEDLAQKGEPAQARIAFEKYLRDNRKGGFKILDDIELYLEFTKQSNQAEQAVKFIIPFIRAYEKKIKMVKNDARFIDWDKKLMLKAYQNAGDEKSAKRIQRRMKGGGDGD